MKTNAKQTHRPIAAVCISRLVLDHAIAAIQASRLRPLMRGQTIHQSNAVKGHNALAHRRRPYSFPGHIPNRKNTVKTPRPKPHLDIMRIADKTNRKKVCIELKKYYDGIVDIIKTCMCFIEPFY